MSRGRGKSPDAVRHEALVLLGDGPWRGRVYWAGEFADMQRAACRYAVTHPAGELAGYVRTRRTEHHTANASQSADVWVFRPGAAATPEMVAAAERATAELHARDHDDIDDHTGYTADDEQADDSDHDDTGDSR